MVFSCREMSKMVFISGSILVLLGCNSGEKAITSNGDLVDLLPPKNSHLLLNYWAEWCLPCKEEIPELNRLYREGSKNSLVVFGINYDGLVGRELRDQVTKMEIEFPVLVEDPRLRFGFSEPEVLPMTVLIAEGGERSRVLVGPQTYEDILGELEILRDQ